MLYYITYADFAKALTCTFFILPLLLSAGKWIAELKKYKGSKKLTQEMVDAFVKQITVYPDKRIAIEWVYADKESELLVKGDEQLAG